MDGSPAIPSPQLIEANRQLHALRERVQSRCQTSEAGRSFGVSESAGADVGAAVSHVHHFSGDFPWESDIFLWKKDSPESCLSEGHLRAGVVATLPEHLGWGSAALTAVLRGREQTTEPIDDAQTWTASLRQQVNLTPFAASGSCANLTGNQTSKRSQSTTQALQSFRSNTDVKLYPDIGLGMLRQEMTAPGRLWLLLRYLDKEGRGVLRIDITVKLLTSDASKLHICGKRQLRNLLHDGEGVFWTRDKVHIWLHSAAKVAHALEVNRLTGSPVTVPLKALLAGIGTFRAHLYGAFHSSRLKVSSHGKQAVPIARDTLAGLSGVGRSSQRAYEAKLGLPVQPNFAVGHLSTEENREKYAWTQGQALFELKDYHGQQGKKGRTYLAWQLPNSYIGQHQHRPKGRQKRINRELNDLVMKGMPGNAEETNETQMSEKIYFPNGKLAAKAYDRDPERDFYWKRQGTGDGRSEIWQNFGN
jgi:hypothetical protein